MIVLLLIIAALLAAVLYKLGLVHASMARTADHNAPILQEIARHCDRMAQPLYHQDAIDRMTEHDDRRHQAALAELERKLADEKE